MVVRMLIAFPPEFYTLTCCAYYHCMIVSLPRFSWTPCAYFLFREDRFSIFPSAVHDEGQYVLKDYAFQLATFFDEVL